jgi:hypothetical protein
MRSGGYNEYLKTSNFRKGQNGACCSECTLRGTGSPGGSPITTEVQCVLCVSVVNSLRLCRAVLLPRSFLGFCEDFLVDATRIAATRRCEAGQILSRSQWCIM